MLIHDTPRHDPLTQQRIHFLCQKLLENPFYRLLKAPINCVRQREIEEGDLNILSIEMTQLKWELFTYGFIPMNYRFFLQPDGTVALTGFEYFHFKMLRPDGSWYSQSPK